MLFLAVMICLTNLAGFVKGPVREKNVSNIKLLYARFSVLKVFKKYFHIEMN